MSGRRVGRKPCRYSGGKIVYRDHDTAVWAAERIAQAREELGRSPHPLYPYACPGGNHWHLTSTPQVTHGATCPSVLHLKRTGEVLRCVMLEGHPQQRHTAPRNGVPWSWRDRRPTDDE